MAEHNVTKKNNNSALILLLLLLLIGSAGLNYYQYNNKKETVITHVSEVDSLINARIDVERELAIISMELEKYRGIAGNLDTLLNDANDKIEQQENRIRSLIANEKNTTKLNQKLKKELAQLKLLRDEYLEKIDNLIAENTNLKNENQQLNNNIVNLNEQKNMLENKVKMAAELNVEYVKVNTFKKRNSGKYVESVIAKRTNKIESCFTIMDNKVSPPGEKTIYLTIKAPNGKTLAGYSKTSFKDSNGNDVDATSALKVDYKGDKLSTCLSYENDNRILESGTYNIQIYIDARLVHQSTYILK